MVSNLCQSEYYGRKSAGGRDDAALYKRMIDYMKRTNVVLTEHIGKSNMSLKAQTKAVDTHIYERDTGWLRECDMVIAECTCPSLEHWLQREQGYSRDCSTERHLPWT